MTKLYDALKASYGKGEGIRQLEKDGYKRDNQLSNHNQQIYYNQKNHTLLNTIAGTHNLKDWGTDLYLGFGKLKDTNRYKEAKSVLEKAKRKYEPKETKVSGHSLGSTIAQYVSSKNDKVYTLDGGTTLFQKSRPNAINYRARGDVVSLLGLNQKHTKNLDNGNLITRNKGKIIGTALGGPLGFVAGTVYDAIDAHNLDKIKNKNIFI